MTASKPQPRAVPVDRRIIDRPRLIKLLDETHARTILLLAPAGYGKTTLARQWAKTLNGAIWVTLARAHRDVAVIATDLARLVDSDGHDGARSFVSSYIKAHSNPQRIARELALIVAEHLRKNRLQWVILDDYHEVSTESEVESFLEVLNAEAGCRFLIASRLRPSWATARLAVYGDVVEINRSSLALSTEESKAVLGRDPALAYVANQAEGWPALVGLAANAKLVRQPGEQLSSNLLHSYFAEELFKSASTSLQRRLIEVAVAPDLQPETLGQLFGGESAALLTAASELGFVNFTDDEPELHPLLRDFLLTKLTDVAEAEAIVTRSIEACLTRERWERAFELILRFDRGDLVEPVLEAAYSPLIRSGQVATLEAFAAKIRAAPSFPPAAADLAQADVALADGAFELASRVAQRAATRLPDHHHLKTRAHMITAASAYAQARLAEAETAYRAAFEAAQSPQDEVEALRGWALSSFQGEKAVPVWVIDRVEARRDQSPLDLVRHTILELTRLHFTTGYRDVAALLEETRAALHQVEDPRTRSSFTHVAAYVTALTARYREATQWQRLCDADISSFDLDFAQPHSYWNNGFLALGLRRFGAAERMLQKLEDSIADRPLDYHVLNRRILRGRLALQTGQGDQALALLPEVKHEVVIPSIHGEYIATRGLALASNGRRSEALEAAEAATQLTSVVEVRVLAHAIRAITSSRTNRVKRANELWQLAEALDVWDPVLAAARASSPLASTLAEIESLRERLADLYRQSNDLGLARRAGLRARAAGVPAELLSPREFEVLGLLARGCRNRDIADALVVSPSTVKVHVRHIFEKLGVRTRSQAVARLQPLDQAVIASDEGDGFSASSR